MPLDDMMYGLSNYAPKMGAGQISPPMEDKDILSPGQPVKKQGGFDWKKLAGIGIGMPLVAALVSKLSGPRGIQFSDALGTMGAGFVNTKLDMQREKRAASMREAEKMRELAHKSVMNLQNLSRETLAAYPKLQELSAKYQDAVISGDGRLSDKDVAEIVRLSSLASGDVGSAQIQQDNRLHKERLAQDIEQRQEAERTAQIKDFASALGGGQTNEQLGLDPGDLEGLAGEQLRDFKLAQMQRETPVPFTIGGQQLWGTPAEIVRAKDVQMDRDHQLALERLRQGGVDRQIKKQQELADFDYNQNRWKMALETALQGFDKEDFDKRQFAMEQLRPFMAKQGMPFDEAGLELALQRAKLGAPQEEGGPTPVLPPSYNQRTKPRWSNIIVKPRQ